MYVAKSLHFDVVMRLASHPLPEKGLWLATTDLVRRELGSVVTDLLIQPHSVHIFSADQWQNIERKLCGYVRLNRAQFGHHTPPLARTLAAKNTTDDLQAYIEAKIKLHQQLNTTLVANSNDKIISPDFAQIFQPLRFCEYASIHAGNYVPISTEEYQIVVKIVRACTCLFAKDFIRLITLLKKRGSTLKNQSKALDDLIKSFKNSAKHKSLSAIGTLIKIIRAITNLQATYIDAINVSIPRKNYDFSTSEKLLYQHVKSVLDNYDDLEPAAFLAENSKESDMALATILLYAIWAHEIIMNMQISTVKETQQQSNRAA